MLTPSSEDGSSRRWHRFHGSEWNEMETLTGNGALLNTSMNRRGEPMVCSPADALDMFFGSDLEYLFLEDLLVTKPNIDVV